MVTIWLQEYQASGTVQMASFFFRPGLGKMSGFSSFSSMSFVIL
jgi:hypothetical protein